MSTDLPSVPPVERCPVHPGTDLTAPDLVQGRVPMPEFAWLRENRPMYWNPQTEADTGYTDGGLWIATRHADVKAVSTARTGWSSEATRGSGGGPSPPPDQLLPLSHRDGSRGWGVRAVPVSPAARCGRHFRTDTSPCQPAAWERGPWGARIPATPADRGGSRLRADADPCRATARDSASPATTGGVRGRCRAVTTHRRLLPERSGTRAISEEDDATLGNGGTGTIDTFHPRNRGVCEDSGGLDVIWGGGGQRCPTTLSADSPHCCDVTAPVPA